MWPLHQSFYRLQLDFSSPLTNLPVTAAHLRRFSKTSLRKTRKLLSPTPWSIKLCKTRKIVHLWIFLWQLCLISKQDERHLCWQVIIICFQIFWEFFSELLIINQMSEVKANEKPQIFWWSTDSEEIQHPGCQPGCEVEKNTITVYKKWWPTEILSFSR